MSLSIRGLAVALMAGFVMSPPAVGQSGKGEFRGEIVAVLLPDGRNMRIVQPFSYVDAKGRVWEVPAGQETDGASIPRVFWTTHPPFTGKYRGAAVVHDYYCRIQTRPWRATHDVFYEAMRTSGVEERTATVMWAAVYNFGPRWGDATGRRGVAQGVGPEAEAEFMKKIDAWVKRSNPSRDEIARTIERGKIP